MKRRFVILLVLTMLLCGCTAVDTPESTAAPTTVPTTVPPTTVPPATLPPETEPAPALRSGYYLLDKMYQGTDIASSVEMASIKCYMQISPDGTGMIRMTGTDFDLLWDESTITVDGDSVTYVLSGELITLDIEGLKLAFRYSGDVLPETYLTVLPVGYFLISSVGQDGDMSIYGQLDPANGYLKLNEDGTGTLFYSETTQEATLDTQYIYWNNQQIPYLYYTAESTGDSQDLLMLYFTESMTSVAFRPAEEPAE